MFTPEQIRAHWDANPGSLEQAITANPGMFGLGMTTNGMGADGFQLGATAPAQPAQDINVGVPGSATQRALLEGQGSFIDSLLKLNEGYAANSTTQAQFDAMPPAFNITEWLAGDPSRTPQQAYEQGLLKTGGGNVTGSGMFGELNPYYSGQRADYADQLNQLVTDSGRNLVEERDGKTYVLNTGQDERFTNINPVPVGYKFAEDVPVGEWGLIEKKDNDHFLDFVKPLTTGILQAGVTAAGGTLLSPLIGTTGAGAVSGGTTSALGGGSPTDILKGAAVGGITSGLTSGAFKDYLPNVFQADNVAGSFVRGASTDVVRQAIMDGSLSFEDAVKAGLINTGVDVVKDVYSDAMQTRDAQALVDDTLLGGSPMSIEDALRLENTSDLHGLLGENGLLSKMGINVGNMPTGYIGKLGDFFQGHGPRTTATIDGQDYRIIEDRNSGTMAAVNPDGTINTSISADDITAAYESGNLFDTKGTGNTFGGLFPSVDQNRYDERYFDITTDRSSESRHQGIFESNPYANTNNVFTGFPSGTSGEGTVPGNASVYTPPTQERIDEVVASLPQDVVDSVPEDVREEIEDVLKEATPDNDLINGTVPGDKDDLSAFEGELTLGDGGYGDITLPPGDIETTLPSADVTTLPSTTGSVVDTVSTGTIETTLPSTTGTGGTPGAPKPPTGMMGGDGDFKAFMSGISYVLPIIQQMGIPFEDFMKMWMNKR